MSSNVKSISDVVAKHKKHSFLVNALIRLVKEKPLGTIGGCIVIVLFLTGIFANFLAPYRMNAVHLIDMLSPPSAKYLLGTDQLGRDILSNLIYGARISMIIGICASIIDIIIAIIIGTISGFIGGKIDLATQRLVDAWMSFPSILLIMTLMSIMGSSLVNIVVLIGLTHGIRNSRVVRSAVIGIKQNVYVDAAKAIGCATPSLIIRHVLPNIVAPVIIIFTLSVGSSIMLESTMSFLGFGVPPGVPSWGSMLSQEGRDYMESEPMLAIWPGFALSLSVYGINMLGDALRDLLDPRMRGSSGRYVNSKKQQRLRAKSKRGIRMGKTT